MMYLAALETAAIIRSCKKVFIGIMGDSVLVARYPINIALTTIILEKLSEQPFFPCNFDFICPQVFLPNPWSRCNMFHPLKQLLFS